MGRRKIEMRRVEDNGTRQVTFSKRRNGIFKKANELATLCGALVAVVVFSPGGRPYSYGSPSVMAVTERFLGPQAAGTSNEQPEENETANANAGRPSRREQRRRAKIERQRAQLDQLMEELEAEKLRGQGLEKSVNETCGANKIKDVNDLDLDELKEFQNQLQDLHDVILNKAADMEASSTLMMLSKDKTPFHPDKTKPKKKKKQRVE